jgi:hypothetical protein
MSKSGTPQNTIRPHLCYIRKPGPESAPPENPADWERLLNRCLRNRREDMLDAIRTIVEGGVPAAALRQTDSQLQHEFAEASRERWSERIASLPADAPERCPLGRYELDYALLGNFQEPSLPDLLDILRRAVVRPHGWPEFWVPPYPELEPIPFENGIECWLGAPIPNRLFHDSAHADFWRGSPQGRLFLLRGFIEDWPEVLARSPYQPGDMSDVTNPTLSVGECFLHAAKMALLLAPGRDDLRLFFRARWYGLAGRPLASIGGARLLAGEYVCHQDEYAVETTVDVRRITDNLPEIVGPLVTSLYERFSFFRLPVTLVAEELARLRV